MPGTIIGPGSLEQAGAGTLILLGDNINFGTTTISAGTLQIGNGGELGSIGPGSVVNNGVLIINRRDDVLFTNLISGTGRVEKAGTNDGGPIEFTASNTYTGSTTINGSRTVLIVDNLANGGQPSDIGASTSDAANLHIRTDATLRYVGPGATTDRLFTIGNARIDASGDGPIVFSNTGAIGTSGGTRTLTLLGAQYAEQHVVRRDRGRRKCNLVGQEWRGDVDHLRQQQLYRRDNGECRHAASGIAQCSGHHV